MLSLYLRNLFFTILQPGIVAGLVPYFIVRNKIRVSLYPFQSLYHYAGFILFFAGSIIMLICISSFAIKGKGTLSPADPTRRLVVSGLYNYSRNPMYVGVMMILIGETVFFQSTGLWIYLVTVFIAFNLFVIFFEEPRLNRDFGPEYKDYCRKVRRWI